MDVDEDKGHCPPSYSLRKGLSLNPKPINSSGLAEYQGPAWPCLFPHTCSAGVTSACHHTQLCMRLGIQS